MVIGPLMGLFAWLGKRMHARIDEIENKLVELNKELAELDKFQAVQASQLKDIRLDIHNVDKKLDKIFDELRKR